MLTAACMCMRVISDPSASMHRVCRAFKAARTFSVGVAQKEEAGLLLLPSMPKEGVLMEIEVGVVCTGAGGTSLGSKNK